MARGSLRHLYKWETPDQKIRRIGYQMQRQLQRKERLDAQDELRDREIQRQFQGELQRKAVLDRQDDIGQQMGAEQERRRGLDERGVPSVEEGLKRFRQVEQRQQPTARSQFEPTPMTQREIGARAQSIGVSIAKYQAMPQEEREAAATVVGRQRRRPVEEPGLSRLIGNVFQTVGQVAAPGVPEEAFLPANLGGLAPPIPPIAVTGPRLLGIRQRLLDEGYGPEQADVQLRGMLRYQELFDEEIERRVALFDRPPAKGTPSYITAQRTASERLEEEMGEQLRAAQPELPFGAQVKRGLLETLGLGAAGVGAAMEFLEERPLAGPFARMEGADVTALERGRQLAKGPAEVITTEIAAPVKAGEVFFEEVTGVPARGKVSGKISGPIAQDITAEVINPVVIFMALPFLRFGTAGLRGLELAAQVTANLTATGLEPALARATLRGITAYGRLGAAALRNVPKAVRESPTFQRAIRTLQSETGGRLRPLSFEEIEARLLPGEDMVSGIRRQRNYDALTPDELVQEELRITAAAPKGAVKAGTPEAIAARQSNIEVQAVRDAAVEAGGGRLGPEAMRLTDDLPGLGVISRRLDNIETALAKPRVKGRAALQEERAKLQAQREVNEILMSGETPEFQLDIIARELGELQTELRLRSTPFRGRWAAGRKFVPAEKDMRMGAPGQAERARQPSAAVRRERVEAAGRQRFPELSTGELGARERVLREFVESAKFEPAPVGEPLVGRARFTEAGEVVTEPTFATEAELAGIRAEQGRLPMGAGERPIEGAGPMFREGAAGPPAPPEKPPPAVGGIPEPPEPPRLPTVSEVEARARPQPPEVRAQMRGEIAEPEIPLQGWDDFQAQWGPRYQENWWTKIEDMVGGPLARTPEEKAVRSAFVRGELYREIQKTRGHAAVWLWVAKHTRVLGLNSQGVAKKVAIAPGAKVPSKWAQRLEHITEHPEKYIISPEQRAALDDAQALFSHVLQTELREGVDVLEVMGGYWRRLIKTTPSGKRVNAASSFGPPRVKPPHARSRIYGDIEELFAWDAKTGGKMKLGSAIEGMADRVSGAVDAIANRRIVNELRTLGVKPSERIAQAVAEEARLARQAYKEARAAAAKKGAGLAERAAAAEAEVRLVNAKRALNLDAKKVMERRPKVLGRLVTDEAAEQMARYLDAAGPDAIEEAFRFARATNIVGDLSAMGIQGWYTFWADHPTWWASTFKGLEGLVRNPYRFVAQNADVIERGTRYGAIVVPEEFLLRRGGGFTRWFVQLPIIRNTQNSFEWWIFTAQTMRWKAAEGMAKNADELFELATVLRHQTGASLMPGLTRTQRRLAQGFFAPKFLAALFASLKDVSRPGPAGAYARRTVAMAFGGAMAAIVAGNVAQGKVPNLTDPDKAGFFGVPVDKGYLYPMGPFQPFVMALFRTGRIAQDIAQGEKPRERDLQAWPRFVTGKLNKYERALIRVVEALGVPVGALRGRPFRGPEIGKGRRGLMGELQEFGPIGPVQAVAGIAEGAPVTGVEVAGVRTTVRTPYQTLQQGWGKEYPDRKFNYEVDYIVADANPNLSPLVAAARGRAREYGAESAIMRETNQRFRAEMERERGLSELASDLVTGNVDVGPELMRRYRAYKGDMAVAMSRAMFEVDYEPSTPEGKALRDWASLNPYDAKYVDPETREVDWDAFGKEQDRLFAVIERIDSELADALETRTKAIGVNLNRLEPRLEAVIDLRERLFDMPRWSGIDKETGDRIQEFVEFAQREAARAKRAGADISETEMARLLGRKNGVPKLGDAAAMVIQGKAPPNLEMVNLALRNEEELSIFFPRDLDRFLPVLAEREALGEEAFERVLAGR